MYEEPKVAVEHCWKVADKSRVKSGKTRLLYRAAMPGRKLGPQLIPTRGIKEPISRFFTYSNPEMKSSQWMQSIIWGSLRDSPVSLNTNVIIDHSDPYLITPNAQPANPIELGFHVTNLILDAPTLLVEPPNQHIILRIFGLL